MSIFALAGASRRRIQETALTDLPDIGGLPLTAPYNAPSPIDTPTPDATGQAVHPSVVDMHVHRSTTWNGWRFWGVWTPYANTNDDLENPCVYVSQDGIAWQEPTGIANPINPWPGGTAYNSDPDLEFDPASSTLWLLWREVSGGEQHIYLAHSTNGTTWTHDGLMWSLAGDSTAVSPCLVKVGADDWRCFYIDYTTNTFMHRTATSPTGTWSDAVAGMTVGAEPAGRPWHMDVWYTTGGLFHMLLGRRDPWDTYAYTSADGQAWTPGDAVIAGGTSADWDEWPYRPAIQPHEDGARYRVWYSALQRLATWQWRIGFTYIPEDEWPEPALPPDPSDFAAYTAHAENGTGLSSYTFSSLALGEESAIRHVAVAVPWRTAGTENAVTGITIGGVAATVLLTHVNETGGNRSAVTWATAAVPTGTTGDIVVTYSGTIARAAVSVWALNAAPTVAGDASTTTNGGSMMPGGDATGATLAESFASATSAACAWSGVTERHEALVGVQSHSAGDSLGTVTASATWASGWNTSSLSSAIALVP